MARRRGVSGFSPIAGRWALIALAVVVGASSPEARDRTESDRSWKASWEARQAREAERRRVEQMRRAYEFRRAIAHARMRSERGGSDALRASSAPAAEAMCPVLSDPAARREYQRQAHQWREQAFRRSTGLQPRTGLSVFSASKPSNPAFAGSVSPAMASTAHAVSTAFLTSDASASSSTGSARMVPLFPSASDALGRQGFARVINHSEEAGEVEIEAFDDEGMSYGPLTLAIDAGETVHFNSNDLEEGNANKGLTGSTGPGQGDWRLDVSSALDIEVLSYIRTSDGFLTAMHDTVPVVDGGSEAAIFNPGSNQNQESLLRLVNPGDEAAEVTITAVDDRGSSPGGGVMVTLPARSSVTYTAAELESGGAAGLEGSIGDGAGKWRLLIESESDIVAMSLLSSPTGHLTNLSTAPDNEEDGVHAVPLFPSASDAQGRQGFLRVMNRSGEGGEVAITAFDDTDRAYETLTLAVGANETKHFNSDDLELGNADKGLVGSTGAGEGDWRLELESALDIEVLSYIRTTDGFLTAMHDVVPRSAKRHRVAVFNPGSNVNQQSLLRLVNPGDEDAEATIAGFDGNGESPGSDVVVAVPGGSSTTLTAQELESGSPDFEGALGDGAGKWSLTVTANRAIAAMSLLSSPTGHLTNLSTAPQRGAGPVETAEEAFEALISPVVQSKCVNCHFEGNTTGNMPVFVRDTDAHYLAKNLKEFEDYLAEVEDGAELILNKIQGVGHGGGVQAAAGTEDYAAMERFLGLLGEETGPAAITPATLFDGVSMEPWRSTLRRAAIVFAGRIPTDEEYAAIRGGSGLDVRLRATLRGLMEGPQFHEFLIRAANDRLLTDREDQVIDGAATDDFVDFSNLYHQKAVNDRENLHIWEEKVIYGFRRAPLELIAHIVENDLPYTEVLTADYIMANAEAAEAYGATTEFDEPQDVHEFKPSEIVSYYRDDESKVSEYSLGTGTHVINPGNLITDYPHAGILNTTVFLLRYPTTATNRNRARSRWTYYHFLGLDVEKSEPRTPDPVALADTNNPTMHNPACTVCHSVLDPVAGAFQNYGDEGFYRDQWGGLDSLDDHYKKDIPNSVDFEIKAQSYAQREAVASTWFLAAGDNTVRLAFTNDHGDEDGDRNIHVDRLDVRDSKGRVIDSHELEDVEATGGCNGGYGDSHFSFYCSGSVEITVNAPAAEDYDIEVVAWADQYGNELPNLSVAVNSDPYREGDTWYRDMRSPGFGGELVPDADVSLPWLAEKIVADPRFADATVKFWWPAIMGTEIAEPPSEGDANFDGRLLVSGAQAAEVARLAGGFRRGFRGGKPYNLKDLLTEIVVSKWFRAGSVTGGDPVRAVALSNAGATRLLTPEELSSKTTALTGFDWQRSKPGSSGSRLGEAPNWTNRERGYGLLYGGIDSDGITKRGRDLTSVMAGVAQRHAATASCPVVMKEFYLLPDEGRRLFEGVDRTVSPMSEFGDTFEIAAGSRSEIETLSLRGELRTGEVKVSLAYLNDFSDAELGDRDILLDRLTVRSGEELVYELEMEEFDHPHDCHHIEQDAFHLSISGSECVLEVPVDIPRNGTYRVEMAAWGDQAGDEPPRLAVSVESDTEGSAGSRAIRTKLAELHHKLLGVEVGADSEDVRSVYDLFVDVWNRRRSSDSGDFRSMRCDWAEDERYFDGIADDFRDWSDPHHVARTWAVVLAYLMTDPRYLHL